MNADHDARAPFNGRAEFEKRDGVQRSLGKPEKDNARRSKAFLFPSYLRADRLFFFGENIPSRIEDGDIEII